MGQITSIKCDKCGYHAVLKTGHDLSDINPETVLKYFDDSNKCLINNALSTFKDKPFFLFNRQIALCKTTKELASVPVFSVRENGMFKTVAVQCDCDEDLVLYDDDNLSECVCPKCEGPLTFSVTDFTD